VIYLKLFNTCINIFFTKCKLDFLRTVIGAKVGWGDSLGFCMLTVML
jgi:hypothetical protein